MAQVRDHSHRRAVAGLAGDFPPDTAQTILASLGTSHLLLGTDSSSLVVDFDSCRRGSTPLLTDLSWQNIVRDSSFAEVSGGFVLASRRANNGAILARDAIGERSLYYVVTKHGLVFASSIHALIQSGAAALTLNLSAIVKYLIYAYVPGRETLLTDVFQLLPGETVTFENGKVTRTHYWRVPSDPPSYGREDDLNRDLRALLDRAVCDRVSGDEAVGASLSGGIDSSLVLALLRKRHQGTLFAYSISFGDEYRNELKYSSLMARHLGIEHRVVEISPSMILQNLDETMSYLDLPIGDPLTVPNYLLFREASRDVKEVFNGEGGDPCFGGPKNIPMVLAGLYGAEDDEMSELGQESAYLRSHLKCYDDLDVMLSPALKEAWHRSSFANELQPYFRDPRWVSIVNKLQMINVVFKGGHHILPKIASLSRPFGVTPKSPLFDRDLVEFSFQIPPQLKLHGSIEKYLLKCAVSDIVPKEIIDRPKSGMLVPVEAWFLGPLREFGKERILDSLAPYEFFNRDFLERLLSHMLGSLRPRHGAKIWLLLTLESWLRGINGIAPRDNRPPS